MTEAQKRLNELRSRQSKERQRMAELSRSSEWTDETRSEFDKLENGIPDLEREIRDAMKAVEGEETEQRQAAIDAGEREPDGEDRERAELRGRVQLGAYMSAAVEMRAADGAELEYNEALKIKGTQFPLHLLAPEMRAADSDGEKRATTAVDGQANQAMWLDRIFSTTAAMAVGVTFRSVMPGVASFPVTTAGASAAQRGKGEAAADTAWEVGMKELRGKRNSITGKFSEEDNFRVPGLQGALRREWQGAMTEGVDRAIFLGDDGGSGTDGDIVGLVDHPVDAAGLTEVTLTQANKVKAPETLAAFAAMVDGKHATGLGDLMVVASEGANTLWLSQIANAAADTKTLASFFRENGLSWTVRGDIETATANGDFGAFVGRGRMIEGAAVAPVWSAGQFIYDPYSGAAKGEVVLTLSYYWDFALVRPSHFRRLKFVS